MIGIMWAITMGVLLGLVYTVVIKIFCLLWWIVRGLYALGYRKYKKGKK